MKQHILLTLLIGILFTGCAVTPTPQNAQEYRGAILKGGNGAKYETYVVNQPYSKVVKTIEDKTKQCLTKSVVHESCSRAGCTSQTTDYNPTFIKGKNKSELHVQVEVSKSLYMGGTPPKGGAYIAVIDFFEAGKNKTKINVHAPDRYYLAVPKAVKHWANQTNLGCPDFTQGF